MQARRRRKKKKTPTKSQLYNSLLDLVPLHLKAPKAKEKLSYCKTGTTACLWALYNAKIPKTAGFN